MTDEDIAKGIVYSNNFDTLIKVPNQTTIRISNLTKTIYGSSEADYAFFESAATLKSFNFMDNPQLRTIEPYAFYHCTALEAIDLSPCTKLETIKEYAFHSCTKVKSILLPNQCLTSFGSYAFRNVGASSVTIPRSLKEMSSAFYGSSITEMIFEEGCILEEIGWGAMAYSQVYNLTIPPSVTTVIGSAFQGTNMRYINALTDKYVVKDNILYDSWLTTLVYCPKLFTEHFTIPETVIKIEHSAFLASLRTSINLPPKLQIISSYSFYASQLNSLTIPSTVTTIGSSVFHSCHQLKSITFLEPSQLTTIDTSCFAYCSQLLTVILPSSVTVIGGGGAFTGCSKEINITLSPNSTMKLDQESSLIMTKDEKLISCYLNLDDKTEVKIPEAATTIKKFCFRNQLKLTRIIFLGNNIETIDERAFDGVSNVIDFIIPSSVKTINAYAFSGSSIKNISLVSVSIFENAFENCVNLTKVEINETVSIPDKCFISCSNLVSVTIKGKLTSIGDSAFSYCSKLTSFNDENILYIPKSLISIGEKAFNSVPFSKIIYEKGSEATEIQNFAFSGCDVAEITLPETIISLGVQSFSYTKLVSFTVPSLTISIGRMCFAYCNELQTFKIPSQSTLKTFDDSPFFACPSLNKIECDKNTNNFVVKNEALYNKSLTALIAYPAASLQTIYSLPESVKSISVGAFYGAKHLRSIQMSGSSLNVISANAFENCKSLQIISFPNSITAIGPDAFKGCTKIQCGQVIELSSSVLNTLITTAQFPKRGLYSCFALSCKQIIKFSRPHLFTSIIIPILF